MTWRCRFPKARLRRLEATCAWSTPVPLRMTAWQSRVYTPNCIGFDHVSRASRKFFVLQYFHTQRVAGPARLSAQAKIPGILFQERRQQAVDEQTRGGLVALRGGEALAERREKLATTKAIRLGLARIPLSPSDASGTCFTISFMISGLPITRRTLFGARSPGSLRSTIHRSACECRHSPRTIPAER